MKLFILTFILFSGIIQKTFSQQIGKASYYSDRFEGLATASGEKYQQAMFTAAHKTLPFGTIVEVTNLKNNKTATVKINDRGPHIKGRIIDLSRAAAEEIDLIRPGVIDVSIRVVN